MADYIQNTQSYAENMGFDPDYVGRSSFNRDSKSLSENNPYLRSLFFAERRHNYRDLLTKAQQWEADNSKFIRDASYNSTASEIARQRAAGLNPDLLAGGSSGSGSSAGVTMAQTDLGGAGTSAENISADSAIVSSLSSLVNGSISTLSNTFATITDAVHNIKNFDNVFSFNQSQARLAGINADSASLDLEQKQTNFDIDTLSKRLSYASSLADLYPYATGADGKAIIPNIDQVTSFLGKYGIDDPHLVGLVSDVMQKPEMRTKVNKLVNEQAKQEAENLHRNFEFYNAISQQMATNELLSNNITFNMNLINDRIQSLLAGDDSFVSNLISREKNSALFGKLRSANDVSDQYNEANRLKLVKKMLHRDFDAFDQSLRMVSQSIQEIDNRIYELDHSFNRNTHYGRSLRTQLLLQKSSLRSLGSTQLHQCLSSCDSVLRNWLAYNAWSGVDILPNGTNTFTEKQMGIVTYSFDRYFENPTSFKHVITPVVNAATDILTFRKGGNTYNTNVYGGSSLP